MIIEQLALRKMALFAYLAADPQTLEAVVVDPAFDTAAILARINAAGYRISAVVNTHAHPDHTAGNAAMTAATGAGVAIHEADADRLGRLAHRVFARLLGGRGSPPAAWRLKDGDLIPVGREHLEVIHTPGHTPGGICLFTPGHLITGDTLFVGGVGRTDLPGGSAPVLLRSIRERIYVLADDTRVWPGHDYGPAPSSSIGREKRENPL